MVAIILGAVLAVFSLAVIVHPFLRARNSSPASEDGRAAVAEPPELGPIYDAIRTLQLEYQLGKIPENLYQEQLRGYRRQAALVLRQQSESPTRDSGWLLEQEVLVARAALRNRNGGPRPCPGCRSLVTGGLAVCPECGHSLGVPA